MIHIRKANNQDAKQAVILISSVLKEIFGEKPLPNYDDVNNIEGAYKFFIVAEDNGKIIGTTAVKEDESSARLSRVYIHKDYRRRGLGTLLVIKALKFCAKKYKRVFLTTYKEMGVEGFYEKFGFKVYKRNEKIWMEKFLSPPIIKETPVPEISK